MIQPENQTRSMGCSGRTVDPSPLLNQRVKDALHAVHHALQVVFREDQSAPFLTELTSNTATTEMALPLLGSLAVAININPLLLMIPATLSASCAFMLPVATPPNAIVFGSGELRMSDMIRTGIIMNLIGVILITLAIYLVGLYIFNIDLSQMPTWAG